MRNERTGEGNENHNPVFSKMTLFKDLNHDCSLHQIHFQPMQPFPKKQVKEVRFVTVYTD